MQQPLQPLQDEFSEYLEQERDLNGLKEDMERRELQRDRFENALGLLRQQQAYRDTRQEVTKMIPQSELSQSSNFFEFQPHLIYAQNKPNKS